MNIINTTLTNIKEAKITKFVEISEKQSNKWGKSSKVESIGYSFSKIFEAQKEAGIFINNKAKSLIKAYFSEEKNSKKGIKGTTKGIKSKDVFNITKKTKTIFSNGAFYQTNNKVTILLYYYSNSNTNTKIGGISFNNEEEKISKDFSKLSKILAQVYEKEVNLITVRVYYPYMNSEIMSKYLIENAKSNNFIDFEDAIIIKTSQYENNIPAHICGIKVEVSGRLTTETMVPRKTKKSCVIGTFKVKDKETNIDYGEITGKNAIGAFTIKV